MSRKQLVVIFVCLVWTCHALIGSSVAEAATGRGAELTVVGFNVESDDSNHLVVGKQVFRYGAVDLWGFSEVYDEDWTEALAEGASRGYKEATGQEIEFVSIEGKTGRDNRLLIVYNPALLQLRSDFELTDLATRKSNPAPLVGHFQTAGGQEFLFVVSRLDRHRPEVREAAAKGLNAWAREQTLPVIVVGTFGRACCDGKDRDAAVTGLLDEGGLDWLKPEKMTSTVCKRGEVVEDLVLVGGDARGWGGKARVLSPEDNYCPDSDLTSNHRPVAAGFVVPGEVVASVPGGQPAPSDGAIALSPGGGSMDRATREAVLKRIDRLEAELRALRMLIENSAQP